MSKRKAPSNSDNLNHDFCEFLMELSTYERNVNKNVYKSNAYREAAGVLSKLDKRITSGAEAKKLKGIGSKISAKIDEFLATGKLQKLEKIHQDDTSEAILLLSRVSGIGPAKARQLVQEGVKTLKDLEKHKDSLTHHQFIGLKYFEDFEKKIPRSEIEQIETVIKEQISKVDPEYSITICGSYRRGRESSGDIDVLVSHPSYTSSTNKKSASIKLKQVIDCLEKVGLMTDTISMGDVKFMGVCNLGSCKSNEGTTLPFRRLDVRLFPWDQYFCSVLYFTGSDLFNKAMRAHAQEKKFTLNEYSLRPVGLTGVPGEPVTISCEEDIFDYIDYPFKKPEERNI